MRLRKTATTVLTLLLASAALFPASAHQSIEVADGAYRVTAGYLVNPPYTTVLNGIDLAVRDADGVLITGLEKSLEAWVLGPEGSEVKLTLRANGDKEGWYTGNFMPTAPGSYTFRVKGYVGTLAIDLLFDHVAHTDPAIMDIKDISLP